MTFTVIDTTFDTMKTKPRLYWTGRDTKEKEKEKKKKRKKKKRKREIEKVSEVVNDPMHIYVTPFVSN